MALPHVRAGNVARAAEQNAVIDEVNDHTATLDLNAGTLGEHTSRLGEHGNRIGALETAPAPSGSDAGRYFGQWSDDGANASGILVDSRSGNRVVDIDYPVGTPVGCRLSAGTFTADHAGVWLLTFGVQFTTNPRVRALFAALGNASSSPTTNKLGLIAGPSMDSQASSAMTRLNAGGQLSIYVAQWSDGTAFNVWRARGCSVTAAWLGP